MVVTSTRTISETVERAVAACDFERIKREYWDQNEFVFLKGFLLERRWKSTWSLRQIVSSPS